MSSKPTLRERFVAARRKAEQFERLYVQECVRIDELEKECRQLRVERDEAYTIGHNWELLYQEDAAKFKRRTTLLVRLVTLGIDPSFRSDVLTELATDETG